MLRKWRIIPDPAFKRTLKFKRAKVVKLWNSSDAIHCPFPFPVSLPPFSRTSGTITKSEFSQKHSATFFARSWIRLVNIKIEISLVCIKAQIFSFPLPWRVCRWWLQIWRNNKGVLWKMGKLSTANAINATAQPDYALILNPPRSTHPQ